MKYRVTEVLLKQAHPKLGSSFWSADVKQGGFESAEYDTADCLITLIPERSKTHLKRRRIHVSSIVDMVLGATLASKD